MALQSTILSFLKSIVSGSTVHRIRCIHCILIVYGLNEVHLSLWTVNGTSINNPKVFEVHCIRVNDKETQVYSQYFDCFGMMMSDQKVFRKRSHREKISFSPVTHLEKFVSRLFCNFVGRDSRVGEVCLIKFSPRNQQLDKFLDTSHLVFPTRFPVETKVMLGWSTFSC